jgi:hypothetical protein
MASYLGPVGGAVPMRIGLACSSILDGGGQIDNPPQDDILLA